jgi:hypothetical protein
MQAFLKGDEQTAKKFALPECERTDAGVKDMLDDLTQGKITRVELDLVCCAVFFEVVALMYDAFGAERLRSV